MKKIMFDSALGLQDAVFERNKTVTRRTVPYKLKKLLDAGYIDAVLNKAPFQPGDEVTIAQTYFDIHNEKRYCRFDQSIYEGLPVHNSKEKGWTNKMFVSADAMPHRIKITSVRLEALQNISESDCVKEGVIKGFTPNGDLYFTPYDLNKSYTDAREAFKAIIDRLDKDMWDENPTVYVYTFELLR